ncbi:MAG: imidazoleglycerol-phosphate dehydratase HisB [bacterium]
MKTKRISKIIRKTKEVDIQLELNLDGKGIFSIDTGIPFFDHMLNLFSQHSFFDLKIKAKGDLEIDAHHTVEDIGICLGNAIKKALGDKIGIMRYADIVLPMDESLVSLAIDISNRPFLVFNFKPLTSSLKKLPKEIFSNLGIFDPCLVKEFLQSFSSNAGITLHINVVSGENVHHIIEAIFKGLGRVLFNATRINSEIKNVVSTKGML